MSRTYVEIENRGGTDRLASSGQIGIGLGAGPAADELGPYLDEAGLVLAAVERPDELLDYGAAAPALLTLAFDQALPWLAANKERLESRFPLEIPVVLVCGEVHRGDLRAALAAGVTGIVLEHELETAFAPCLRAVLAGQICVPRQHSQQLTPPALSPRERQILGLVVMGYMNGQIAEQLFVSESTVKSHLSSAFGKLGVRSRGEAVELIVDSEGGLGMGILALGGERIEVGRVGT